MAHRHTRSTRRRYAAGLAAAAVLTWPAGAQAEKREKIAGGYIQAASCIPSGGAPTSSPTVFSFQCATGTGTWTGDLRGQTRTENLSGTYDVANDRGTGQGYETTYIASPDGRVGTLYMFAVFSWQGQDFSAHNTILSGTGDFAGAEGELWFEGDLYGTGCYHGWIKIRR